jgi:CubicO group peptidase (beta-lactamase class C family)
VRRTRDLLPLALVLTLAACQSAPLDVEQDIAAIESSLLPVFRVQGEIQPPATVEQRMQEHNVPGMSVSVYIDGELAWAKGYGIADKESGRPVTTQTLFQAASISKPVSATAAHDMAEDGLLDFDEDINAYLTSWTLPANEFTETEKVTIRRITNHTAGTTVWGFPGFARSSAIPDPVGVVSGIGNTDPVLVYKTPGESWQYSGGGYTVMQIAMSDVAGAAFQDVLADRVLGPMGMTSSTYEQPLPKALWDRAATGYFAGGDEVQEKWRVYPMQAAGGLWTTATDLGRWAVDIQRAYAGAGGTVLERETVGEMLIPGDSNFGLGPALFAEGTQFGHGGANAGFRSALVAAVDGSFAVAVVTNSNSGGSLHTELLNAIFDYYEWPGREVETRVPVEITDEELDRLAGTYEGYGVGRISVAVSNGQLVVEAGKSVDVPIYLRPESPTRFFGATFGQIVEFDVEDGQATGLRMRGSRAELVD